MSPPQPLPRSSVSWLKIFLAEFGTKSPWFHLLHQLPVPRNVESILPPPPTPINRENFEGRGGEIVEVPEGSGRALGPGSLVSAQCSVCRVLTLGHWPPLLPAPPLSLHDQRCRGRPLSSRTCWVSFSLHLPFPCRQIGDTQV